MTRQWQKVESNGPDLLIDSDDIVATFFILLPEFLRFPENSYFPTYRPLGADVSKWLRSFEDVPPRTDEERSNSKYLNLVGAALLSSSIVFRRHAVSLDEASDLPLLTKMFETFTPMVPLKQETPEKDAEECNFFSSVAEVSVSLDSVTLDIAIGSERESFRIRDKASVTDEIVNKALDTALEAVRSFQLAYYGATREAVTLVVREMLSPVFLVSLRTMNELSENAQVEPKTFLTGNLPSRIGVMNDLGEDEMNKVSKGVTTRSPLTRYLDLYRQGTVALRQGNTRECVVMMSVAAESLINVLLAHLQWEECLTPETSADTWVPSLDTRIKTVLPSKLGGNWDTTKPGAIHDWNKDIASIRHRVVHAGYRPSMEQAQKSIDALNALVTFLGDRVTHSGNLRKYSRTALTMLGSEGLRRRDRYTRAVREIERDRNEVQWDETFSRWYDTQILCIQDQRDARHPDISTSTYYIIFISQDQHYWVASDWGNRKAVKVAVTLAQGALDPVQELRSGALSMQEGATVFPISAQVEDGTVVDAELKGEWQETYHLMPLQGVMRDKSDFVR
ncbi:hypothetical protein KKR91_01400 [Arthrobacter jiangjiafuii]|uniref:Uncharacterized protein n=1 Tax=Arthrobacter jiangjiafuii TaxID=2817475 RepID=A0A975QZX1_9MICC|nr:hypothetical protein [Arthrobacter jiangjiafuii]MBP3044836.1 hypothetical protein [Arthrobacter jiangjiafuii]QWC10340.1 hypothetical protein KKR91_01400 [Arthrobacter jiangjiafuii]